MRRFSFAIVGVALAGLLIGAVGLAVGVHDDRLAHGVSIEYNESLLQEYQPRLVTDHLTHEPILMYGWVVRSADHDSTALVYVTFYHTQEGVTSYDSHYLDREPVIVFVDEEAGEVDRVSYAAYHWLANTVSGDVIPMNGTHPTFRAADLYHHYLVTPRTGENLSIEPLGTEEGILSDSTETRYESWLETGWEGDLEPRLMQNPWRVPSRGSWWRKGTLGISVSESVREFYLSIYRSTGIDIAGAANTDLVEGS